MTDEEILQLNQLKRDRDKIRDTVKNLIKLDRKRENNPDGSSRKGFKRFVNSKLRVDRDIGKDKDGDYHNTYLVTAYNHNFELDMDDFANEIMLDRIRESLSDSLTVLVKNLVTLEHEVTTALEEYGDQDIAIYIREKVKRIEAK
jgi:hypothetical protein